jgi:hypothetical protein
MAAIIPSLFAHPRVHRELVQHTRGRQERSDQGSSSESRPKGLQRVQEDDILHRRSRDIRTGPISNRFCYQLTVMGKVHVRITTSLPPSSCLQRCCVVIISCLVVQSYVLKYVVSLSPKGDLDNQIIAGVRRKGWVVGRTG